MWIDEHRVVLVAVIFGECGTVRHRNINRWRRTRCHAKKFGWCHTCDGEWDVVNAYGLANDRRISGESVAPTVITEDRDLRCTCDIIAIADEPAHGGSDSDATEEIARDKFDVT